MAPELEACGWYVRTKRTAEDSARWLVADCSAHRHGSDYARQFAATGDMLTALETILAGGRLTSAEQAMCAAAIAKATGRDVADVVRGSAS
jgi:hypothetical protein